MKLAEFPGDLLCSSSSCSHSARPGAAVRVSGIDDDAMHLVARFLQVNFRGENGSSTDAIVRKHRCGGCGGFANEQPQIEARLFQPASGRGEREAPRNV